MSGFVNSDSWFYLYVPKSHKQKEVEGVKGNWNPRCVITKRFQEHFIFHSTRRTICWEDSHMAATMNWPSISPRGRKEDVRKEGRRQGGKQGKREGRNFSLLVLSAGKKIWYLSKCGFFGFYRWSQYFLQACRLRDREENLRKPKHFIWPWCYVIFMSKTGR